METVPLKDAHLDTVAGAPPKVSPTNRSNGDGTPDVIHRVSKLKPSGVKLDQGGAPSGNFSEGVLTESLLRQKQVLEDSEHDDDDEKLVISPRRNLQTIYMKDYDGVHHYVESASPMTVLPKPEEATIESKDAFLRKYFSYLTRVYEDLRVLEPLLEEHSGKPGLVDIDLASAFRLDKVAADIGNMKTTEGVPFEVSDEDVQAVAHHKAHFEALAVEDPVLLAAHACLRYFAILFGGKTREVAIKKTFGGHVPLELYDFGPDSNAVRSSLLASVSDLTKALTSTQYDRFVEEIRKSWEFAGDVVGIPVRAEHYADVQ